MLFDDLSELGSYLSDGFKMDEIVSLLQKTDYKIRDKDRELLTYIQYYFNLAKQGYYFYEEQKYPKDDLDEVLNTFSVIVYVLINNFSDQNLSEKNFLEKLEPFEEEIKSIKEEGKIELKNVNNSLQLFQFIGRRLLEESYRITEGEADLFEP